jgi:hypothetical protein
MKSEIQNCPPDPQATIESIRALGYDLNIAISDLIDNSITAGAQNIWVLQKWEGEKSVILVFDDGRGMNNDELFQAMRIGSSDPKIKRKKNDLGRFGLGLKVASWSQCKKLTVTSKLGKKSLFQKKWDIDFVCKNNSWDLLTGTDKESNLIINKLLEQTNTGTVVLWQDLDRLIEIDNDNDENEKHFYNKIESLKKYLSMIFHRYLSGPKAIKIHVSNLDDFNSSESRLKPWDPFLEKNTFTQNLGSEKLKYKNNEIIVTPFVLPHHSKYLSNADFKSAGGINGWNEHQGFFVYRERRLIMFGGWLGFAKAEDHYKLARIRVDISNNMDSEWKIGVKKIEVTPPDAFRNDLKKYADIVREKAAKVYRFRGAIDKRGNPEIKSFIWKRYKSRANEVSYKIERKHPLIEKMIKDLGDKSKINMLLNLVEKTVPVETIIVSDRDDPNAHVKSSNNADKDKIPLKQWYNDYMNFLIKNFNLNREEAFNKLLTIEPFNYYIKDLETLRGAEKND